MRGSRARTIRPLVVVLVAALIASACGDDGDTTGTDPTTTLAADDGDTEESDDDDTGETDDGTDDGTGDAGSDDTADTTTTAPLELTDSFRGVTAEAIKVGAIAVDLEALRGLVDLDHGSYEDAYRAIVDDVNANGGVLGRDIELIFESYIPVGSEPTDEICSRLVEDEQVFAVMGGLIGDAPLCYTQLNDTVFIGGGQNDRRVELSAAPWFSATRNIDDATRVIIGAFAERGYFDGSRVAVVADVENTELTEDVVLPLLDELQVDVIDVDFVEASLIDDAATEAEVALMAERQRLAEIDTVLTIDGVGPRYAGGIEDLGFRPRILTTSLAAMRAYIRDRGGRDLSVLTDSVAGNTLEQLAWWDDPIIQDCIDIVEEATGTTILDPNTRGPDEPENIVSVLNACQNVRLFTAIASAAGADLTNDTFAAAGASLGDFAIPGLGVGHYDADNPDGNAPIYLYDWNPDIEDYASDGTVIG